jgi:hypothetical protein
MNLTVEQISYVVHEANRALQRIFRDPVVSPTWLEAPASQRDGLMNGVQMAIDGATPQELHEEWVRFRLEHGWKYGPVKDEWSKRHPCLVPYDQLPEEQRVKDYMLSAIVRTLAGYLVAAEQA